MKIPLPEGEYFKKIEVGNEGLEIEFAKRKKVALLFISLNDRYWPYLAQVIQDCRQNFLPQHQVDYFAWTDYTEESKKTQLDSTDLLLKKSVDAAPENKQTALNELLNAFATTVRLYEVFFPQKMAAVITELQNAGLHFKREGNRFWVEAVKELDIRDITLFANALKTIFQFGQASMDAALKDVTITETAPIEWPAPTLMRYHLFLQQQEKLKDYDYVFYMDADMRVVSKISDEILGTGITAAEHPMYSLRKEYIPPYEPNPQSTAYIHRPGKVVDENGKPRFKPYYYAGGFQGGPSKMFIEAMEVMKANIDKDFNNNYVAVWNDESHWNKYLSENTPDIVLSPAYIYPDSLIKEYYEKVWGRSYEPKIITLTKPFSLSAQGADEINKFIKQ
jgi:hypothetical protein